MVRAWTIFIWFRREREREKERIEGTCEYGKKILVLLICGQSN